MRIAILRLISVLLLEALPGFGQGQDYDYTITDGQVTIVGYVGSDSHVVIPDTIEGLVVTGIMDNAFYGDTNLASVLIPEGVTHIGIGAFGFCTNLTSIAVDQTNTQYSDLDGVLFDKAQSTILQFPGGRRGGYTIPDDIIHLGERAFACSPWLTSVVIPDSVIDIGRHAFCQCEGLTNILFGSGVMNIGESAFFGCTSLKVVVIPDSVTHVGNGAFNFCSGLEEVTIGNTVGRIGDYAFQYCVELRSMVIPDSVTTIGKWAFGYCWNLIDINISESVTGIGESAFADCESLNAITVDALNTTYSSVDGVMFDKSQTRLIQYPAGKVGNYSVPEGVVTLGIKSFFGAAELSSITMPDSVTNLGSYVFAYCSSLGSVVLSEHLVSIGDSAFFDCRNLSSIDLPNSVTNIGVLAFSRCVSLSHIEIPDSVLEIDNYAFQYCRNLVTVSVGKEVKAIGKMVFDGCSELISIIVDELNPAFSSLDGVLFDKEKATLIRCPAAKAGSATVPGSVESVKSSAFRDCASLTAVRFEGDAPSLGSGVFEGSRITTIYYLPETSGWTNTFGGRYTAIWRPMLSASPPSNNQIQFNIDWANDYAVDVEAAENLTGPVWRVVDTVMLTNGAGQFTAPVDQKRRYYRLKWE